MTTTLFKRSAFHVPLHCMTQPSACSIAAGETHDVIIAYVLTEAGASVTITSVCNSLAFLVARIVPMTALQDLLLAAAVLIIFNYITAMTLLPAMLSLWAGRFASEESKQSRGATYAERSTKVRECIEKSRKDRKHSLESRSFNPFSKVKEKLSCEEVFAALYSIVSQPTKTGLAIRVLFFASGVVPKKCSC